MTKLIIPVILAMLVMPAFSRAPSVAELKQQALQGNTEAQVNLGLRYENGKGVLEYYLEAVKWYRRAAEQGDPMGQLYLGKMYLYGYGVSENRVEAHKWSNLAASKLTGEDGERASRHRAMVKNCFPVMSTDQVNKAQRLAAEWKPKTRVVIRQTHDELKIGPPE